MAARVPGQYEGAAPEANYYLFRTEDAATETPVELSHWVAAAERADSLGVDVINISLGYLTFDNPAENLTYVDLDGQTSFISKGANTAFEKGMIVVASAGNYGTSTTHPYIVSPADATGAIAVGAVNSNRSRVSFSSIGPSADNRIKPDIAAMGGATALVDENQNVVNGNGTSYSAPIISGGIACLIQAFPNKTPSEIRTAVLQSADQYTMPDNTLGYGIPDFDLAFQTLNIPSDKLQKFSYYLKESRLYIHTKSSVKADLKIYNLQGKLLLQSLHRSESVVKVDELASGVYIAQLSGYKPIKFVVN
jgi:subtilisin family serine protease